MIINLLMNSKKKYDAMAILFTVFTLMLISFTLPTVDSNIVEFMDISRTLLLAWELVFLVY